MIKNNRIAPFASALAPDLASELLHWRRTYPNNPFYKSGLRFDRYAATFKFGYDTFLLNRGKSEAELFPRLCHQYKDGVAACDRIDWAEARMIVAATWERLRGLESAPAAIDTVRTRSPNGEMPRSPFMRFTRWNWLLGRRPADLHAASTAPRQAAAL